MTQKEAAAAGLLGPYVSRAQKLWREGHTRQAQREGRHEFLALEAEAKKSMKKRTWQLLRQIKPEANDVFKKEPAPSPAGDARACQ